MKQQQYDFQSNKQSLQMEVDEFIINTDKRIGLDMNGPCIENKHQQSQNKCAKTKKEIQTEPFDDQISIDKHFQSSQGFQYKKKMSESDQFFNSQTTPKVGTKMALVSPRNPRMYKYKQNVSGKIFFQNELIETFKGSSQFDEKKLIKLFDVLLAKVDFVESVILNLQENLELHGWHSLVVLDYYLIAYKFTLLNICFELAQGREPGSFLQSINFLSPRSEILQAKNIQKLFKQIINMQEIAHREFKNASKFMKILYKSKEPAKFNYLYFQERASIIIKDWLQKETKSIIESKQCLFACLLYKFSQFEQLIPIAQFEDISISTIGYVDESDEALQCYKNEIAATK